MAYTLHCTKMYTNGLSVSYTILFEDNRKMSFPNSNNKQFLMYQLKWMGIYIAIGGAIALILPFPVSLLAALGAFVLLNYIRTRRMLKRAGVDMKGLFKSLFSSTSIGSAQYSPLKYYCMSWAKNIGKSHVLIVVRKMKRVG